MNADEFIALVAKYPLPWSLVGGDWEDSTTAPIDEIAGPEAYALSDAAPAMAAAAIRLLRKWDSAHDLDAPAMHDEMTALRAALPESLRP